jgi:hypothetical protein
LFNDILGQAQKQIPNIAGLDRVFAVTNRLQLFDQNPGLICGGPQGRAQY